MTVVKLNTFTMLLVILFGFQIYATNKPNGSKQPEVLNNAYEEAWLIELLQDIAFYLRSYKFNEWDRRYFTEKVEATQNKFHASFPTPPLRSLHWQVNENCQVSYLSCVKYLHSVIATAPFTRQDQITNAQIASNDSVKIYVNRECNRSQHRAETNGAPFEGPLESFQWRTTAAYFMCWFTMKEVSSLSLLGNRCDNFANCYDPAYGYGNRDPRADDTQPFYCAAYSFCPDPCCPLKHVISMESCYLSKLNPCYLKNQNKEASIKMCTLNKGLNRDFRSIISNHWNVSCYCDEEGFTWSSRFGTCVDIDECATGSALCEPLAQNCINLRGSYECICKWGYELSPETESCTRNGILLGFLSSV